MTKTNNNSPLLQGTIYDKRFFRYLVNFDFHDQAVKTKNLLTKLSLSETCVMVPMTPSDDPLLIQVLLFDRIKRLLREGAKVIFFFRDKKSSEKDKSFFSALIKKHFADHINDVSQIFLSSTTDKFEKNLSSAIEKMEEKDKEIRAYRKDTLAMLLAKNEAKAQFLLIGQVEAYDVQYWLERIRLDKSPLNICPVYLPELWLFAGTDLYFSQSSKEDICRSLIDSRYRRFRSIWEYCLHISVVAASLGQDDMAKRFLSYSTKSKKFISQFDKDTNALAGILNDLFLRWSI